LLLLKTAEHDYDFIFRINYLLVVIVFDKKKL
jgi:hypothetical protein